MENKTEMKIGPALAIVVVIAVVAVAGILFYKDMVKDLADRDEYTVTNRDVTTTQEIPSNDDLSSSTDLDAIAEDLEATVEADLSILDELDEELLDFSDLEDLDFEL